ncbi:MAG: hypothetical protein IIX15_02580 [Clostridia bacterium]|nr:hypothetical protein [Clostridia bacterium]
MGDRSKSEEKSVWWRRTWVLILGAAVGVALILLGNGRGTKEVSGQNAVTTQAKDPLYEYTEMIEKKIAALCASVCGVSEVQVAISFEGDFTYVYATDSDTQEKDGMSERQEQYVTVGSGSSEQTILLTRTPPALSGIGIVCCGGGDAAVRQELMSLLSAAFGIGSNKIYIAEANS